MCIIAIKPKGQKMFDQETIRTMFANNPDGAGYMFCDGKQVIIRKGFMCVDTLLMSLSSQDLTDTNVVLHFRIGTSGKLDALNCHPFPIYDKNKVCCKTDIALAHNGILRAFEPSKKSPINDTQNYIQLMLKGLKKGFQNDEGILNLIEYSIDGNRFAFLDSDNKVTLIGDFITDDGYIYSNWSFLPKKQKQVDTLRGVSTSKKKSEFDWLWDEDDEEYDDLWADIDRKWAR